MAGIPLIGNREWLAPAERVMSLAAFSILELALGVTLQVNRFIDLLRKEQPSEEEEVLDEFISSDSYNLACMLLSIAWIMVVVPRSQGGGHSKHVGNYLIYGLFFFALGGGFLALFQFMAFLSYSCSSNVTRAYAFIKIVFIIAQVILIYRCRHGHVFSKPKSIVNGLFLFHTVITDVVLYITTFLESKKDFAIVHHNSSRPTILPLMPTTLPPSSTQPNCTVTSEDFVTLFQDFSIYLYPFFLEFTLTSSAMLAEFWMKIDEDEEPPTPPGGGAIGGIQQAGAPQKTSVAGSTLIGLLVLGSFFLIIILMHYLSPDHNPGNIFKIFNLIMSVVMTCLCLVGFTGLWPNDFNPVNTSVGLDEVLLIASLFGSYSLALCNIYAAISVLSSDEDDYLNSYAILSLVSALIWIIQTTLQSTFIAMALHRKPRSIGRCSGIFNIRNVAIVLAFSNLGMWLSNTIDLEGHYRSVYSRSTLERLNKLQDHFFGRSTWTWIMLVIYPLAIFFRIHLVSTLYQVWKTHKKIPDN